MSRARVIAVLLLTLGCLAWALWGMDVGAVAGAVAGFDARWLAPGLAALFVVVAARAFRFACLLEEWISPVTLASPMQVGFLAISVMPFRLGEFVRPYLLAEYHGVPFGAGLAAVVMERLLDMLALLALLTYIAWFVDLPERMEVGGVDLLEAGQRAMGVGLAVGGLGVLGLAVGGPAAVDLLGRAIGAVSPALAAPVTRLASSLVTGFRALFSRPVAALGAALGTAAIWLASIAFAACMLAGFPGLPVTFDVAAVDNAAQITAVALIPTPGFVGAWEAGAYAGLAVYGVDDDLARAFAIAHHAAVFAFNVIVGLYFLARQGLSLRDLVRQSRARAAG